jgi:hypothetical protein
MSAKYYFAAVFTLSTFLLFGCSTTPLVIDDKYRFSEFETVDSITSHRISGWQSIDSQSLIVETSPSTWYLLVLMHKVRDLNFSEAITLSATGTQIQAKFDCVQVESTRCLASTAAPIDTIYKLNDRSSVQYVKNRIRNS